MTVLPDFFSHSTSGGSFRTGSGSQEDTTTPQNNHISTCSSGYGTESNHNPTDASLLADQSCENANLEKLTCTLIGDGCVGKTSLVISYTTNGYPTEYVPTAFDNFTVDLTVDHQPIRLELCDTAGQDEFDTIRPLSYPKTDIFILCFSVVNPNSFSNIKHKWLPELKRHCPSSPSGCGPCPVLLVGTQCDLRNSAATLMQLKNQTPSPQKPVSQAEIQGMLKESKSIVGYVECSALTQHNLKDVFDEAITFGLKRRRVVSAATLKRQQRSSVSKRSSSSQPSSSLSPPPLTVPGSPLSPIKSSISPMKSVLNRVVSSSHHSSTQSSSKLASISSQFDSSLIISSSTNATAAVNPSSTLPHPASNLSKATPIASHRGVNGKSHAASPRTRNGSSQPPPQRRSPSQQKYPPRKFPPPRHHTNHPHHHHHPPCPAKQRRSSSMMFCCFASQPTSPRTLSP